MWECKYGLGFAKLFSGRRVRKIETNFLKFGGDSFWISRAGRVWEGMRASKNTNTKNSISIVSRSFLLLCGCPSLKGMHPRHSPRAFPLWLLAPRCLCAGITPRFLGRGSFLSPGRATNFVDYHEIVPPSPSPLYALHIYVRGVAFATKLL